MAAQSDRKPERNPSPRAWQRMLSGRRLDLLDPSPLDVEIEDIAHGLARVARWNGQTRGDHAFSVAQHSLVVEAAFTAARPQADADAQLAALLHDAPEYVIGDMISPFKAVVGGGYKEVEKRLQRAIHLRFSLPADTPAPLKKAIKRADQIAAWFEATRLAGFSEAEDSSGGFPAWRMARSVSMPMAICSSLAEFGTKLGETDRVLGGKGMMESLSRMRRMTLSMVEASSSNPPWLWLRLE